MQIGFTTNNTVTNVLIIAIFGIFMFATLDEWRISIESLIVELARKDKKNIPSFLPIVGKNS